MCCYLFEVVDGASDRVQDVVEVPFSDSWVRLAHHSVYCCVQGNLKYFMVYRGFILVGGSYLNGSTLLFIVI